MVTAKMKESGISGGEGGQRMTALAVSEDGKLLIAGTDVAGMWRSENGGKNWEMVYGNFYAKGVFSVAIDPVNRNRVIAYGGAPTQDSSARYANMANGIYLSEDGGKTWEFVLQQKGAALRLNFTESLAYDPSSYDADKGMCMVAYWSRPWELQDMPQTSAPYYTGEAVKTFAKADTDDILTPYREDTNALWKTTDGGITWNPVCTGMTDGIVKVHPTNGTVYVSNLDGFHRSTDGGKTFTTVLGGRMIYGMDVINTYPDRVYVNDTDGVWMSSDCGETFTKVTSWNFPSSYDNSTPDGIVRNLKVNPHNPDKMVISSHKIYNRYQSEKYYTTTGGLFWSSSDYDASKDFFKANNRDTCYVWSPVTADKLWAFGGDWVVSSTNAGKTYSWDYNGGSAVYMDGRAAFNIYNPDIFYYGAQDFHGALTTDGGDTWKHIWKWTNYTGTGGTGQGYGSVYGAYAADENTLVAIASIGTWGAERRIFMSYDAGETWTDTGVVVSENTSYKWAEMCYQSPKNPDVIFAGNYRSADKGKTWTDMDAVDVVCCHNPYDKMELYGYDVKGNIKVSYDDGATWQLVAVAKMPAGITGGTINDMAYDGINKAIYYVSGNSSSRSFYKLTLANGVTTDLTNNLVAGNFGVAIQLVAVDPVHPEVVYVGGLRSAYVQENSVQRSTDGGKTFEVISTGGEHSVVKSGPSGGIQPYEMLVHPQTGELWVSNGCRGWSKIAPPYKK